jgi:predicted NAD-dependent protein-ADP-ribosyltransferase YbiA (DUF1768 family)
MVSSVINPSVQYVEKRTIDPEDKGHLSSMYIIELFDTEILVVLGKPKYTFSEKDIVYYPIYVVSAENKIKSQVGVFESKLANTIRLVDSDGDIDVDKLGEPLIYSFVNKKYIQLANSDPRKYENTKKTPDVLAKISNDHDNGAKTDSDKHTRPTHDTKTSRKDDTDESSSDDENDVFALKVSKNKVSKEKEKTDRELEKGVFKIDSSFRRPETLVEETESDADETMKKYRESSSNQWIEKFMKNNNYGIVDNEGSGDCFFAVIRDAYAHIGYNTTVHKLRALLASQLTLDKFESERKLYLEFETRKSEIKNNMKEFKQNIDEYNKRIKKLNNDSSADEIEQIKDIITDLTKKYEAEKRELKKTERDQSDYTGYISQIDTLDKYREYIKTSNYWADGWAISTLEALLKVKFIIFSEESYNNRFNDGVLNCGIVSELLENKPFDPEYYIMTTYSGDHYKLITYKNKHIFNYKEIPYNVKILIVNKCLERNSGIYYKIQDFRNFKSRLGLNPDEGALNAADEDADDDDDIETMPYAHLYNKSAIFTFHSKSLASAKPGMGTGESIESSRRSDFTVLGKIPNWRRKLDDSWVDSQFRIDNHNWASVEHYVQASKFKKGFPDFYVQFSIDYPSELSRDPELAKAAADIKKSKHKSLRPANIKEDVDYSLGRNIEEREAALRAKFTQHDDLKDLLYNTRDALLKQYIRRQPAKSDIALMKIRQELRS